MMSNTLKKEVRMQWLKNTLSNWKVTVALVGGALVVGSTLGTCSFAPAVVDGEAEETPAAGEEVSNTNETTNTAETTNAAETNETTNAAEENTQTEE